MARSEAWEAVGEMSWGLLVLCCAALLEGYELGLGGGGKWCVVVVDWDCR